MSSQKCNVFTNLCLLPHALVLIANMLLVLLFANSEINSRVAGTCPFYYYAFAQLVVEVREEMGRRERSCTFKHLLVAFALLYNTVVMLLNMFLFSVEIGFV